MERTELQKQIEAGWKDIYARQKLIDDLKVKIENSKNRLKWYEKLQE